MEVKEFEVENGRIRNIKLKVRSTMAPAGRHRAIIEQGNQDAILEFSSPQELVNFGLALARAGQKHKEEER